MDQPERNTVTVFIHFNICICTVLKSKFILKIQKGTETSNSQLLSINLKLLKNHFKNFFEVVQVILIIFLLGVYRVKAEEKTVSNKNHQIPSHSSHFLGQASTFYRVKQHSQSSSILHICVNLVRH